MNRLAQEIHVPANRISLIVAGQRSISGETALRLGLYFGTTAAYWINMQARYEWRKPDGENRNDMVESCNS
jgi:addiction module HigA family antidote